MGNADLALLALMVAVAGLGVLARRIGLPYSILLVLGGLMLGFVPGMPPVQMPPDLVLLLFLPPLLYSAGFLSSPHDLRAEAIPITRLAVGLTLATMGAVAVTAHALVPDMPWPVALTLGAIVSPTDPLAATAIARRLGAPRRVVTVIEGEGLANDATALVAYRIAVGVALGATVTAWQVVTEFVLGFAGGVVIGLVVGWLAKQVRRRVDDPLVETSLALATAYAAYLPAQWLGVSGVLAAVTAGLYVGWHAPTVMSPSTRLIGMAFWEVLDYLLNAVLFILVGLQLHPILTGVARRPATKLLGLALLVSAVVIAVRVAWHFTVPYLSSALVPRRLRGGPGLDARQRLVVAWSGMRGAVSLTVALALPTGTETGRPFPERDLIVFVTYVVIFTTLVLPGVTLPVLIRRLGVRDEGAAAREETLARLAATDAALTRLDELLTEARSRDEGTAQRLRRLLQLRRGRLAAQVGMINDTDVECRSLAYRQLVGELIEAQRRTIVDLRDRGQISTDVLNRVQRDLDLEESRLEI
ncbi:Na+/H+ antiporter [Planosporangium mesophilum]|uniref:Na+/H+ antiporter n=1 Tax=Planosporangium mesophilum TaxID=689768 RepID=A0A8J3X3D1_9ACTN|nr:Na+/H+ antiporter [Planosporangium mesophilum]NJC86354.1 Na+/H+ antiporter [Planosporangium mesophilum]GII25851.1 Na+/H+ antiporter [Planosporangium mesophilum]